MRKFLSIIAVMLLAVVSTSCLKHDLEELEVYSENDIVSVQGVYWRWIGTETIPGSGEHQVLQKEMNVRDSKLDKEAATLSFKYQIPSNFPKDQVNQVTASKLVVILNISPAAVIEPVEGAPRLGAPGDWSKPNKYKVTAADGSAKVWTVSVSKAQ